MPAPQFEAEAAYREAEQRIAEAAHEQANILDLSDLGLTSVPPEIGQLASLTSLHLFLNNLTSLPPTIGQLVGLTELYLYGNKLTSVPPEIGQLASLNVLDLERNQLTSVPAEIGLLTKLVNLDLRSNKLTSIPNEIGQLVSLTALYLNNNQLRRLPAEICRLSNLEALFLHRNSQLNLPTSLLGTEPKDEDAEHSGDAGPEPILDYYFGTVRAEERRPLNEAKLILVGRGDAGKTSLVKRLVENKFSRREDTTQGIRIQQWSITVGRKRDEVQLNVWDFGGQEIMHATHQFFLTDRSLYLLVLDGRAGQQEAEADYWLRMISGFAPESPVLVVLNKIKKDHFTLNRSALQQKYPQVQDFIETDCDSPGSDKKPGKNGHGIDKLRKAIAKHVNKLPDVRMAFPNSWFAVKEKLSKGQASRRKTKSRRKNFLTPDEFRSECEKLGETDPGQQDSLSVMLHRLGIALNFGDDKRLNDRHVLNPHWLTTGIYTLLNSKTLAARKGELRPRDLVKELDENHYPSDMHPFLIHVMEKFELCFGFDNPTAKTSNSPQSRKKPKSDETHPLADRYLIPELLDPEHPPPPRGTLPRKNASTFNTTTRCYHLACCHDS